MLGLKSTQEGKVILCFIKMYDPDKMVIRLISQLLLKLESMIKVRDSLHMSNAGPRLPYPCPILYLHLTQIPAPTLD